jgi:acylphosphatase
VQNVGFRYFSMRRAAHHAVRGAARNLPDGRVEIIAIGARDQLEAFHRDIQKGPPLSKVDNVDRETLSGAHPDMTGYDILFRED